jgi:hypothetical protein
MEEEQGHPGALPFLFVNGAVMLLVVVVNNCKGFLCP